MPEILVTLQRDEIAWVVKALEHAKNSLASALAKSGQLPERDSAYHRYKMLEEMFRAYEA